MKRVELCQNWSVSAVASSPEVPERVAGRPIAATVPGCIHTDLLAAGLIDDPEHGENEQRQQWVGRTDWVYRTAFEVGDDLLAFGHLDLVCDGLDTVAELRLNDQPLGASANMNVRQRFNLSALVRPGTNTLSITFASPIRFAENLRDELGALPAQGNGSNPLLPFNFIRKMACNFGWDWGPALTTCGIWRPIRLEAWSTARLENVRPIIREATPDRAVVDVHADTAADNAAACSVEATIESPRGDRVTIKGASPLRFELDKPELWWPVGYGEQPLYQLSVLVRDDQGNPLDETTQRIGLRTCELVHEPDATPVPGPVDGLAPGAGMELRVNGKRVFCKGANFIPDDYFPHRVTADRYLQRIRQSLDANMNMLRVWGGGLFESDTFYELCDERGLMVWQDMLFACAAYPEDPPFPEWIEQEVRDNVGRLMHHPSLVLWNGNNENFMAVEEWDVDGVPWREIIGGRPWGRRYYLELIPRLLEELDPQRPYWPGSPYSGTGVTDASGETPLANANEFGNRHIWDVWFGPGQYRNYLAHFPRFASEFGYHGPPTWPVIERVIPDTERRWNSPAMERHNKMGGPGQGQSQLRMADDFVPPEGADSFDDWLYLAQVMQARALEMGVTWFRALSPYCSGALYWQLNDCWPVSSWSAIDSDGRRKPLWYASRRFFVPRLLTIKPIAVTPAEDTIGTLAVFLHNDADQAWSDTIRVQRRSVSGETEHQLDREVNIAARASARIDIPAAWLDSPEQTFLVAESIDHQSPRAFWWFQPDKELAYPEARFRSSFNVAGSRCRLEIQAESLIRDLCLYPERLNPHATVCDQMLTLLPGEHATFEIENLGDASLDELTSPPVLQSVNRFGRCVCTH